MGVKKEIWDESWRKVKNTLEVRDVFWVSDQVKFSYVKRVLPGVSNTLEVGMGSARISAYLAQEGCQVFGVDYSANAIEVAKRNFALLGLTGTFCLGDAFRLPFSSDCFDMVFSTGLIEHFEDPSPIVVEMVRVLRPGGVFWSDIAPRKFSLLRSLDFLTKLVKRDRVEIFEREFSKREVELLLSEAGLREVDVFAAGVFPPRRLVIERIRLMRSIFGRVAWSLVPVLRRGDKTIVAEWLGFYYFCSGVKPGA